MSGRRYEIRLGRGGESITVFESDSIRDAAFRFDWWARHADQASTGITVWLVDTTTEEVLELTVAA